MNKKYTAKLKTLFLFIVISSFLISCASVVERPQISIDKVELGKISLKRSSAVFTLNVKNPNRFPIYLSGIEYGLKLNGTSVAEGANSDRTTISAGSEQTIQIPVSLRVGKLMKMIPTFLGDMQFKYELDGKVKTPFINLPFHRTGGIGASEG